MSERASPQEIINKYGVEGYSRIFEMDYQDVIMKNYKSPRFDGIENYYPRGLSVEDIDKYIYDSILWSDYEDEELGINHNMFKQLQCANFIEETEEFRGLVRKIRDRQLFETKLGIRNNLSNDLLEGVSTEVLNPEEVHLSNIEYIEFPSKIEHIEFPESQEMDRSLEQAVPVEPEVPVRVELINPDLIRMKQEQDDWFNKLGRECIMKCFLVRIPAYAAFLGTIYGCVSLGVWACPLAPHPGGGKKRKSLKKKRKNLKKKRKTKRKSLKKKRKTKKIRNRGAGRGPFSSIFSNSIFSKKKPLDTFGLESSAVREPTEEEEYPFEDAHRWRFDPRKYAEPRWESDEQRFVRLDNRDREFGHGPYINSKNEIVPAPSKRHYATQANIDLANAYMKNKNEIKHKKNVEHNKHVVTNPLHEGGKIKRKGRR